jgi:protein-tyrosine-phosphatase
MSSPSAAPPGRFTLLLVCTGNVCRSPLAERLGDAYLAEVLGEDFASTFRIVSAGTQAVSGHEMDPDSALVLRGLGGNPEKFWAQQLTAELAAAADLTLTMTRQHREEVLGLSPRGLARTFTLLEAADLMARVDPVGDEGAFVPDRARSVVRAMAAARAGRRASSADDIRDPIGRPVKVHQEIGEVIADAMLLVLGRLLGVDDEAGPPDSDVGSSGGRHGSGAVRLGG